MLFITECVTCSSVLKTYGSGDITGIYSCKILSVVSVHLNDTSESFTVILGSVEDCVALIYDTGVYTEKCQLTNKRVCSNFECKS